MDKGRICVSVCGRSVDEINKTIAGAASYADLIEIRVDCIDDLTIEALDAIRHDRIPVVITYRPDEQGGKRQLSTDVRAAFWYKLADGDVVDLEEDIADKYHGSAKRIVSFHDFDGIPSNLPALVSQLKRSGADIVKIAGVAEDAPDAIELFRLLETASTRSLIPIAMGDAGLWTRILGLSRGAFLTYASADTGSETASGQISAREMVEMYRVREIRPETRVFGVVGDPVSSSLSPVIHNAAFQSDGVDGVFLPIKVKDCSAFFRRMVCPGTREVDLHFSGFSVTMPHKQAVIRHLDELDAIARAVGAVNTVAVTDDGLVGYNTDASGFLEPLRKLMPDIRDARVAVVGGGGAARACAYALRGAHAIADTFVRDPQMASDLGDRIRHLEDLDLTEYDILVNATPVGMRGPSEGRTIAHAADLAGLRLVYDLVTIPVKTQLLKECEIAGVPHLGGLEMLLAQASMQYEIWTGKPAPSRIMRDAVMRRISDE